MSNTIYVQLTHVEEVEFMKIPGAIDFISFRGTSYLIPVRLYNVHFPEKAVIVQRANIKNK